MGNALINLACIPIILGMLLVIGACYVVAVILAIPVWLLVLLARGWHYVRA